jgi:hypothetical protein
MKGCFNCLVRTIMAVLLLAAIGLLAAWLFLLPNLDRTLEDSIRRQFLLAPSSAVVVNRGSLLDTLEGEVDGVEVESNEAKLDGLVVSDFRLKAEYIRINLLRTLLTQKAEFTEFDRGEIRFSVTEQALLDRWSADLRRKGFSNIELELDETVRIAADFDLRIAKIGAVVTGWIESDEDGRIRFTADEVEVQGAKIALEEIKASVSGLAPVIDLGRLKLDLKVDELRAEDGMLYVGARTRGLDGAGGGEFSTRPKFELEQQPEETEDEGLLSQIRGLLNTDGEERQEQYGAVVEQLKERGIETKEQLAEFAGKQMESLGAEYQNVLKELNRLIESQIKDDNEGADKEDAADGGQDQGAGD